MENKYRALYIEFLVNKSKLVKHYRGYNFRWRMEGGESNHRRPLVLDLEWFAFLDKYGIPK